MSRISILSQYEIKKLDNPPLFNDSERGDYFIIPPSVQSILGNLTKGGNKVGFVLQLGYFRASNKFYNKFHQGDVAYVAGKLGLSNFNIEYADRTRRNHRQEILKLLKFNNLDTEFFEANIANMVSKQMHPRKIIFAMMDTLQQRRMEIPNYDKFARAITKYINNFEQDLSSRIENNITNSQHALLMSLTDSENNVIAKFKIINQSVKPIKIKQSVSGFVMIKNLYHELADLIDKLDLSSAATKYYATWVIKAKTAQLNDITDDNIRFLYLLAFIDHQYKCWQDIFIEIIKKVSQQHQNKFDLALQEENYKFAESNNNLIDSILEDYDEQFDLIDKIKSIIYDENADSNSKINKIKEMLPKNNSANKDDVQQLKHNLYEHRHGKQNFVVLRKLSRKLQNRLAGVITHLDFVIDNKRLEKALLYYQNNKLSKAAPYDFMTEDEVDEVYSNVFDVALYKVLLFMRLADAIRSGGVCLEHSYDYMSIKSYLVKDELWLNKKDYYIDFYGLRPFADIKSLLIKLNTEVDERFLETNSNLSTNKYVNIKDDGKFSVTTPAVEKPDYESIYKIIGYDDYVSILNMMAEINAMTGFTNCFKHHKIKGVSQALSDELIFGGLFAVGSNIGVHKLSASSQGLNYNTLYHGVHWHFSLENLYEVNNILIDFMNRMWLPNQFRKEQNLLHTSSDGKKRIISAESLNANYSYKYFGHGKGANIYTFIDERNILFYSTVFSSSERDAAYVIDGLQHNSGVKSDIHSTDTDGYSEIIFAITFLLSVSFAPRIKDFGSQVLSSFGKLNSDYKIAPGHYIKTEKIEKMWDTILRLMVTILMREEKASVLLKRLASYDKQHKLYAALKEFGKITKTSYILRIINDVMMRQYIEKQINKSELSNKFQTAISFAKGQELMQTNRDDQEKAAICQVILQNIIVCWNYVRLTKVIMDTTDKNKRAILMQHITNGSILMWRHVNMLGIYDFRNLLTAFEATNAEEVLNFSMST
jgi:TnpA family transposase